MAKKLNIRNMFFIQRAAIDVLLLNKATALEICTYLVISKHTDRYGYYSGVGYKSIKERLGVGQKKVEAAIKRLRSMEYGGQRLLYSYGEWTFNETGDLPTEKSDVGWVRGWFDSEYDHHVWLTNKLVGRFEDLSSPLKYFSRYSNHDNHARLLLLMYKFCNRQYSGVNHKLVSIKTEEYETIGHPQATVDAPRRYLRYNINGTIFRRSRLLNEYYISNNILKRSCITIPKKEIYDALDDLQKNGFLSVSLIALGDHDDPDVPAGNKKKKTASKGKIITAPTRRTKKRIMSLKQKDAYAMYKERLSAFNVKKEERKIRRISFKLGITHGGKNGNSVHIKLIKIKKATPLVKFAEISFGGKRDLPKNYTVKDSKFVYRLDYKSTKKRSLKSESCLAAKIESVAVRSGLDPVSRNGKFYRTYWWFEPQLISFDLVGVLVPSFTIFSELSVHSKTQVDFDELIAADTFQAQEIIDRDILRV